jgi:hypothetical protein
MAQVAEWLSSMCKAFSSNPSTTKKKKHIYLVNIGFTWQQALIQKKRHKETNITECFHSSVDKEWIVMVIGDDLILTGYIF